MATPFHFHANVANHAARQRADKLRQQMRFVEARNDLPAGKGAAVLIEAQRADMNGDDQRFGSKPDPTY